MKYEVVIPFIIYVTVKVEAGDEDDAICEAIEGVELTNYCGHGGYDRLVGTVCHAPIEIGDYERDESGNIAATATLVGGRL